MIGLLVGILAASVCTTAACIVLIVLQRRGFSDIEADLASLSQKLVAANDQTARGLRDVSALLISRSDGLGQQVANILPAIASSSAATKEVATMHHAEFRTSLQNVTAEIQRGAIAGKDAANQTRTDLRTALQTATEAVRKSLAEGEARNVIVLRELEEKLLAAIREPLDL